MENFDEFDQKASRAGKSTGEIISHAFEIYKNNFGWGVLTIILIAIISGILGTIASVSVGYDSTAVGELFQDAIKTGKFEVSDFTSAPGFVANQVISNILGLFLFPVYAGYIYISQKTNRGETINFFSDLLIGYRQNFVQYIIYALITGIISTIAFAMCVVPAIFILPLFLIGIPIILFENASAIDAITKSFNIAKDNYGTFLGTGILSVLIGIAGVFLCGIGLIFTMPFIFVAVYSTYTAFVGVPREVK